MKFFLGVCFVQTLLLRVYCIGQDDHVCEGSTCYFAGRSPVDRPDHGDWACRNEYKDAAFASPVPTQAAFDIVSGLLNDVSETLTMDTLYAPDEDAEPVEQIIPFCGSADDSHLFKFYFADLNGDGRKDFACQQDYDGIIRWCTDWTALGKCEPTEFTGFCRERTETNTFQMARFINDAGHDTLMCMVSNGNFYLTYDNIPSERGTQSQDGFCTGSGRLHFNDINNDGLTDIICNTPDTTPADTALLSNGDGSVSSSPVNLVPNGWCGHVNDVFLSADFNGDGLTDIICVAQHSGHVYVEIKSQDQTYFAGGSTWFEDLDYCLDTEATVIVGDFNADGRDDVGCYQASLAKIDIMYSHESGAIFEGVDRVIEGFCPQNSLAYVPRVYAERLHEGEGHTIVCIRESRVEAGLIGAKQEDSAWVWEGTTEPVTSLTWQETKSSTERYETYNCGSQGTVFHDDYILMYAYGDSHLCTIVLDEDPSIGATSYTFTLRMANVGNSGGTSAAGHHGITFNWQDQDNYEYIYVLPHQQDDSSKSCFSHGYVSGGAMTGVHINDCVNTLYHKGWTEVTIEMDYTLGKAKAYIDGSEQAEWITVYSGGRVGACSYNPYQESIVAFSYFDVNPGISEPLYQPEFLWRTSNCLTNENVVSTDGTFTLRGDPDNDWNSGGGFCVLTAMDATPYHNDYEFSVLLHFQNQVSLNQAGIVFNWQDDSNFDVLYLRPYSAGCVVHGYWDGSYKNHQYDPISCGDPGIHANDWNLIHVTVDSESQLVSLFINDDHVASWNYDYSGGAVGAHALNGFDNTILFKDFKLVPRKWKAHNCADGWYDITNEEFVMHSPVQVGNIQLSDGFCHSTYNGSTLSQSGLGYVFTGHLYLEEADGNPGFVFNYQDENNFDFVYFRKLLPETCFQEGAVIEGDIETTSSGTTCGDDAGIGNGWIDFKLVMDTENSQATAYIDGKLANQWETEFTEGGVGGAVVIEDNVKTVKSKDFQLGRLDGPLNPGNYETYNCGTGLTLFNDEIEVHAEGSTGWPGGHFCQVIATAMPCTQDYMYFELDITSLGATTTDEGHPALIFNWQDETNYEFFYMRSHSSSDCFEYGYVQDGSINNPPIAIDCSSKGVTVAANTANTYAIELSSADSGATVKYYIDGVEMHSYTTNFPRGRVGFGTVNVPSNVDQARANYFAPQGCRPEKPERQDGDFAIISGKDGLTYGTNTVVGKDFLKPICTVSSDIYNGGEEHVVFRVAKGSGGSTSLHSLWTTDAVEPEANQQINNSYFSRSSDASESLLKSPIIDMSWTFISEAKLTLYKHGNPVASANFDLTDTTKSDWYSMVTLVGSSYSDMADGFGSLDLAGFKAGGELSDCNQGQGWIYVSDSTLSGSCDWETAAPNKPAFFYSDSGSIDFASSSCVSNCLGMADDVYATCFACNVYTECVDEVLYYKSCHHGYEFSSNTGECVESFSNCTGGTATGVYLPDVCDEIACQNGGSCEMAATGWQCVCAEGFEGMTCQVNIDECADHDCDHGDCLDGVAGYSCNCTQYWTGDLCDEYDDCLDAPCVMGECQDGDDDYTCDCLAGYSGKDCDVEDVCVTANVTCENDGECVPADGSCECESGYIGDLCELDDPCLPNPCNVGTCEVHEDLQQTNCTCPTYYSGDQCEVYDDCGVEPCENNGTCTDTGDDFACNCTDGFMGKDCSTVDRCYSEVTCDNNGTCQSPGGTCDCTDGWIGDLCEDVDYCSPEPCDNDGACQNGAERYTCECSDQYVGVNCSLNNPCLNDDDFCENGGTCMADDQAVKSCACPNGFEGDNCQTGPCEKQERCSANGECTNLQDGAFSCECQDGFVGSDCSIVDPCLSDPCTGVGSCEVNDDGTYTCDLWAVQDSACGLTGNLKALLLGSVMLTVLLF